MAGKTFKVEVVTPDRTLYSNSEVESLRAPAWEGSLGVLHGHAPLLCALTPGELNLRTAKGEEHIAVSGGFMEVGVAGVIVLADAAELAVDIDPARAQKAVDRARERLSANAKDLDRERAEAALRRAQNRLTLGRRYGAKGVAAKR